MGYRVTRPVTDSAATITPVADEPRARIAASAAARRAGLVAAAEASAILARAVSDAHAAGIPVAEIARLAGLTRATVYAWLRD